MSMRLSRIIVLALAGLAALVDTALAENTVTFEHKGMRIVARPAPPDIDFGVEITPAEQGGNAVRDAIDLLYEQSPYNREAIERLKAAGRVIIIYDPQFPPRELNKVTIASYLPDYYDPDGVSRDFVVIVGRFGVKWSTPELATVLAHELTGHGTQNLRGHIGQVREVDLECEAYLYQEKAQQDLGFDKGTREMIASRQELERYWCADFKTWLRKNRPAALGLWDRKNPDVPAILKDYLDYIEALRSSGVSTRAVAAAKAVNAAKTEERMRELAESNDPRAHLELANLYGRGIGVPYDPEAAFHWRKVAAEAGLADAQYALARDYRSGSGISKNLEKARHWAKTAAEQGHPVAAYLYGVMLFNGDGGPRERENGIDWVKKASAAGVEAAAKSLGKIGIAQEGQ